MLYEPREDTYLILREIRAYARGNVLDMGTGTGILAAAASKTADFVIGTDINEEALEYARKKAKTKDIKNIKYIRSDLFSYFRRNPMEFDLIIFNPPYLPEDKREPADSAIATTGGKKGYEIIEKFFSEANRYLTSFGKILVVFSTLTGKDKVHSILEEYGFNYQKLAEKDIFQETILVYIAEKNDLTRSLEANGIERIRRLTRGKRGEIFTGRMGSKKIAVKKQREDIEAAGRIKNEARWLKVLNRKGIGPNFLFTEDEYFVYEFVEGDFLPDFLKKTKGKRKIKNVLKDVFRQCFKLDKMGVNKEEMHNPFKHVIVNNEKSVLIDFERTHATEKPKNVTQFCQYVSSKKVLKILEDKNFKYNRIQIISFAKRYKKNMNEKNFKKILRLLK